MNQDHLGYITKLGISITTISTISLIVLNRSFYFGYFIGFEINPAVIPVEMKDLLTPQLLILAKVTNFVFGYLFVLELYQWGILKYRDKPKNKHLPEPRLKMTVFEHLVSIGALLYFVGVLAVCIVFQNWSPFLIGLILFCLGMMLYFALDCISIQIRMFSLIFIICSILLIESIDGYFDARKSQTLATIITQNGETIKDSRYLYANSQTYFIMKKDEEKILICIPRSQVLEVSIYEKKN